MLEKFTKRFGILLPALVTIALVVTPIHLVLQFTGLHGMARSLLDCILLTAICAPPLYALDAASHKQNDAHLQLQVAALESTANGVVIVERSGRIVWANPALTEITGYSLNQLQGQNVDILHSRQYPRSFYDNVWKTTTRAGQVWRGEIVNNRKDGREYTEELTVTPVRNNAGEITHVVAIKQDVTERRQLEQQLRQAQKMEAVGLLSGGIAHDFNNLLGVIIGYSEILEERLEQNSDLHKSVEQIKKAGQRAVSLIRQLLAFSRQQVLAPRVLDLNTVVADTEKMLRRVIGEDVELIAALAPELGHVRADQGQIEQVIMNMAVNARDAMPEGGKLIIETMNADLDEEYALRHPPTVPGKYVMLVMTDTGIGMDEKVRSHIFEPFFTTKELGKGTGLGLSTVYGIVKQSGGYIWVESTLGRGSTFKIYLPQVADAVPQSQPRDVATSPLQGSETILLVEDEEPLRSLTCMTLEQGGYTVLEANGGSQAIEIARQHHGPIHLLLTDMVMPGMNGLAVAQNLMSIRPEMKVIYMSGYTNFTTRQQLDSEANFLPKPIMRDALLLKLHEVLNLQKELTANWSI